MEHPSIIFKIVCPDRPGLVSLLTSWISNYGGNIKHSDHHTDQDAGLFLSRIEWNSNNESFNRDEVDDLIRKGRDIERIALARAVRLHLNHQVFVYNSKTAVFD